jgi:hypothetical protein
VSWPPVSLAVVGADRLAVSVPCGASHIRRPEGTATLTVPSCTGNTTRGLGLGRITDGDWVNDASLQIVVPVGEPVDVDRLRSIFSDAGMQATIEIEERRIVNLDINTGELVSLFVATTWGAFIAALAKTTGERAQDRLLEILRKVGSIVKKRKPPSRISASGKVTEVRWGPLAVMELQTGIVVMIPYDISWPALHNLLELMKYATAHDWCAQSRVVYSPEADIWILKRPPDPLNNDPRTVFVWDSIAGQFASTK